MVFVEPAATFADDIAWRCGGRFRSVTGCKARQQGRFVPTPVVPSSQFSEHLSRPTRYPDAHICAKPEVEDEHRTNVAANECDRRDFT